MSYCSKCLNIVTEQLFGTLLGLVLYKHIFAVFHNVLFQVAVHLPTYNKMNSRNNSN